MQDITVVISTIISRNRAVASSLQTRRIIAFPHHITIAVTHRRRSCYIIAIDIIKLRHTIKLVVVVHPCQIHSEFSNIPIRLIVIGNFHPWFLDITTTLSCFINNENDFAVIIILNGIGNVKDTVFKYACT